MRRRKFLALAAGVTAWPVAARAQQRTTPKLGILHSGSAEQNAARLAAFLGGLREAGFTEGRDVAIEYRWGDGQNSRLPDLAEDLIQQNVAAIATPGSAPAAMAAKRLTSTIPLVFATGGDPVALGLVASLRRPGGNVTGVTSLNSEIAAKRIGLMRELIPSARRYFAFINPASPLTEAITKDLLAGAAHFKVHLEILHAGTDAEIEAAFARLPPQPGNVLVFPPDAFFYIRRVQLAALAARHAMPAIFDVRDYAEAGGLIAYGADFMDVLRLAGGLTGRVLKGENPADLPVMQPTKFELVINLKTAKALGLEIPPLLLARADEVIE